MFDRHLEGFLSRRPTLRVEPERIAAAGQLCLEAEAGACVGLDAPVSRIGGAPMLDEGTIWPFRDGRRLSFLLVLDLAEIRAFGHLSLPGAGFLNVFASMGERGVVSISLVLASGVRAVRATTLDGPVAWAQATELRLFRSLVLDGSDYELLDAVSEGSGPEYQAPMQVLGPFRDVDSSVQVSFAMDDLGFGRLLGYPVDDERRFLDAMDLARLEPWRPSGEVDEVLIPLYRRYFKLGNRHVAEEAAKWNHLFTLPSWQPHLCWGDARELVAAVREDWPEAATSAKATISSW